MFPSPEVLCHIQHPEPLSMLNNGDTEHGGLLALSRVEDLLSCPTAAASSFENTRVGIVGSLTYGKEESIPKIFWQNYK